MLKNNVLLADHFRWWKEPVLGKQIQRNSDLKQIWENNLLSYFSFDHIRSLQWVPSLLPVLPQRFPECWPQRWNLQLRAELLGCHRRQAVLNGWASGFSWVNRYHRGQHPVDGQVGQDSVCFVPLLELKGFNSLSIRVLGEAGNRFWDRVNACVGSAPVHWELEWPPEPTRVGKWHRLRKSGSFAAIVHASPCSNYDR